MGATTKYLFPYPEPTDSVDVPRDVKALADRSEAVALAADSRPAAVAPMVITGSLAPGGYYAIGVAGGFGTPELRGITWNSTTGVFTVPVAGLYRLAWGVSFAPIAAPGTVRAARIDDGAGSPATRASVYLPAAANVPQTLTGTRVLRLAAAATVRLTAFHDAAVAVTVQTVDTFLSIGWEGV